MPGVAGILRVGIVVGALAIAVGELGRTLPWADVLTHFRPQLAIVVGTLAVAAMPVRRGLLALVGAAAAGWATIAVLDDGACPVTDGGAPLRLMTFNVLASNYETDAIAARVLEFDPDVVVFQEFGQVQLVLRDQLRETYPHQLDCANDRGCRLALFAKQAWTEASITGRSQGTPPTVTASFGGNGAHAGFTLVGAHLAKPIDAGARHAADIDVLANHLAGLEGPIVVAGDFNATPWSFALADFRARTGLCGAPGYRPSWPSVLDAVGLPIDQVFVSPGVGVTAEVLAPAGSDHLPIGAVVSLP